MGKCECGSETDWKEIGGTWICVACRDDDIKKSMLELKEGLTKVEQTERFLNMMKVDTLAVPDLIHRLKQEINKIQIS